MNSFWSLAQARVVISDWKDDYNRLGAAPSAISHQRSTLRCTIVDRLSAHVDQFSVRQSACWAADLSQSVIVERPDCLPLPRTVTGLVGG
jgi:hypothetical protein